MCVGECVCVCVRVCVCECVCVRVCGCGSGLFIHSACCVGTMLQASGSSNSLA